MVSSSLTEGGAAALITHPGEVMSGQELGDQDFIPPSAVVLGEALGTLVSPLLEGVAC